MDKRDTAVQQQERDSSNKRETAAIRRETAAIRETRQYSNRAMQRLSQHTLSLRTHIQQHSRLQLPYHIYISTYIAAGDDIYSDRRGQAEILDNYSLSQYT